MKELPWRMEYQRPGPLRLDLVRRAGHVANIESFELRPMSIEVTLVAGLTARLELAAYVGRDLVPVVVLSGDPDLVVREHEARHSLTGRCLLAERAAQDERAARDRADSRADKAEKHIEGMTRGARDAAWLLAQLNDGEW